MGEKNCQGGCVMERYQIYLIAAVNFIFFIVFFEFCRSYIKNRNLKKILNRIEQPVRVGNAELYNNVTDLAQNNWKKLFSVLTQLSVPEKNWETSQLRLRFLQAGFRKNSHIKMFYAIKTLLFLGLPVLGYLSLLVLHLELSLPMELLILIGLASLGYFLPEIFITKRIENRKAAIRRALPDFLDLLVICAEAGMGMDAALNRVTKELVRTAPCFAEELQITMLEINSGASRDESLKHLSIRVQDDDLTAILNIFSQVQKTGTSLGEALRTQAEILRVKRLQVAEEKAAKVATKMLIPLVTFMFPTLLIIILGPTMIMVKDSL
jgi:tight adherence protein C